MDIKRKIFYLFVLYPVLARFRIQRINILTKKILVNIQIFSQICIAGQELPLLYTHGSKDGHVLLSAQAIPALARAGVGANLCDSYGKALFILSGARFVPAQDGFPSIRFYLEACENIDAREHNLVINKQGYSLASITLSDKSSQGLRLDKSGPLIIELVKGALNLAFARNFLLPDDPALLKALLADLALYQKYDLIITTGGTGLGLRDFTPQVTESLLNLTLPGFSQAMMNASLAKTPHAMISRAVAGLIGQSLIINLPGSARAVKENLETALPALKHALDKIHGDNTDCGG